jgi:hypothetical protein
MFNKQIYKLAINNYYTPAVGLAKFDNPYLLQSQNQVLNKILENKHLLDKHRPVQSTPLQKIRSQDDDEDLARHVMREVYESPNDRRDISGFRLSTDLSSDETAVYVGPDTILFGLRGSSVPKDFIADAEVGLKNIIGYPDSLSETINNRFARDEDMYKRIRAQFPNKHIIMAGHSLGNTLGMNILKNHQGDRNINFYGYNGWVHPDYNKDNRAYHTRQEGDLVSTFTPTDNTLSLDPSTRIGVAGVGVAGSIGYIGRRNALENLATISREVDRLQERAGLGAENASGTQITREQIEEAFPEYTNVRNVLDESDLSDFDELQNTSGFDNGLYIRTEDTEALHDLLFEYQLNGIDLDNLDWADLHETLRQFNSSVDLAAHPELTNATDWADSTEMIDPFYYPHNVYVTDGDAGLTELNVLNDTTNIEGVLYPPSHSGIMDQSRITSSEILDTPGTIQLRTGTEVLADAGAEDMFWAVTAGEVALASATATGLALVGGASLVALGYWWWSHEAGRFKLKNNRFRIKK